jgi:hypothetical protein
LKTTRGIPMFLSDRSTRARALEEWRDAARLASTRFLSRKAA